MQAGVNPFRVLGNCPEGQRPSLRDRHGRSARYLRLSLTDRCNLHCLYCRGMEDGVPFIPHDAVLRYEELAQLVGVAVSLGTSKVRITGGEPFARKGCADFLLRLRRQFPTLDLRLTSNGTLLEPHITLLRRIGLSAVNLSLDSFDRQTFRRVTGHDLLPQVLSTLDALLAVGIRVKLNAVAMRGVNDRQMADFVHAARTMPVDVRFIEFMPMGSGTRWTPENFWSASEIQEEAARFARLVPEARAAEPEAGPARMFRLEGGLGRLGFISPLSNHFCSDCNRLRISSNGNLRTCLFADREYRLRPLLRHPAVSRESLVRAITAASAAKPIGADILKARRTGEAVARRHMVGIGG